MIIVLHVDYLLHCKYIHISFLILLFPFVLSCCSFCWIFIFHFSFLPKFSQLFHFILVSKCIFCVLCFAIQGVTADVDVFCHKSVLYIDGLRPISRD